MLINMMNESQSRPHGGSELSNLETMIIETESLLDLVRFIHFYHEKLGMSKPIICYFSFKKKCYYWVWIRSKKPIYLFSKGKCPPNGKERVTFFPFKGDKVSFVESNNIKNNTIEILECRSRILVGYLKGIPSPALLDISKLPGFKTEGTIEIIRLASYYRLPIFLYQWKGRYLMVIGLIPELSLPNLKEFAYHLIARESLNVEDIEDFGYVLYIEGEGEIGEAYKLSNKVKILDVFAPLIKVKKILGKFTK